MLETIMWMLGPYAPQVIRWLTVLAVFGTLVVPNVGEGRMLHNFLNKTAAEDQTVKLYVNNITPSETDTDSTYTEMSTQGYADKDLTGASWSVTEGAPSFGSYAQQVWTFDGTGGTTNVYGYYVVQQSSGILLWAERFSDGPYTVTNNGDQIKITPRFEQA